MKLVAVESPFGSPDPKILRRNVLYARMCIRDSLERPGVLREAPWCSHLVYPQPGILDEQDPQGRRAGLDISGAWGDRAACRAVYEDLGLTSGVLEALDRAKAQGQRVARRRLREDLADEFRRQVAQDPLDPENLANAILEGQKRHGRSRDGLVRILTEVLAGVPQHAIWV